MKDQTNEKQKTYPKGHFVGMWIGIGISMFAGFGIVLSVVTGNHGLIGIGPAIGVGVGAAIGTSIEKKHEKEGRIRPKNNEEMKRQSIATYIGLALVIIGIVLFLLWFI